MNRKNIVNLFFLLSVLLSFNSCVDDPFNEDDTTLEDLLYNYSWIETYEDGDAGECFHEIYFNIDGCGHESFEYENPWYDPEYYEFEWFWNEDDSHTIDIYYEDGIDGSFRNIWIDDNEVLTGRLNGIFVAMH